MLRRLSKYSENKKVKENATGALWLLEDKAVERKPQETREGWSGVINVLKSSSIISESQIESDTTSAGPQLPSPEVVTPKSEKQSTSAGDWLIIFIDLLTFRSLASPFVCDVGPK